MASGLGIAEVDFTNIIDDLGVDVSWESVTKTTHNISGAETLTYAAATTKKIYFVKRAEENQQSKEGLIDVGDATILIDKDFTFKKDDRITYRDKKYLIINDPILREASGIKLFYTCYLKEVA